MSHSSYVLYQKENFWKDYKRMKFDKFMKKYAATDGKTVERKAKAARVSKVAPKHFAKEKPVEIPTRNEVKKVAKAEVKAEAPKAEESK